MDMITKKGKNIEEIAVLLNMTADEVATLVEEKRIPYLVFPDGHYEFTEKEVLEAVNPRTKKEPDPFVTVVKHTAHAPIPEPVAHRRGPRKKA